jgi:ABC-2 type transport system ATP-binding protein
LEQISNTAMSIIEVQNLTKVYRKYNKQVGLWSAVKGLFHRTYDNVYAVHDVNFALDEGELVGFLGPNGAGKTTTLKMLSGLIYPTSGTARVMGYVPWERDNHFRRNFGLVMGMKNQLWWDLPANESLLLNKELYGVSDKDYDEILGELTRLLGVEGLMGVMVRELSLGERMKFELIAALLHSPRVIYLDEPTIGLDVVSQKNIREFLREYNRRRGNTFILTSHYMDDIQALCERVIIINHGRVRYDGRLRDILDQFSQWKMLKIDFANHVAREAFEGYGEILSFNPPEVRLRVARAETSRVCQELMDAIEVRDLTVEDPPIEEIIARIFTERTDDGASA